MSDIAVSSVFSPIITAILQCFTWFEDFFFGEWGVLVVGLITFAIFGRLIIAPLFGGKPLFGGSSDSARKKGDEE